MNKQYHNGFTLIEILIAVVILSIGLLGMAGIQLKGLRSNYSADIRSQAALLANDIAERMHANPVGATNPNLGLPNTNYANINSASLNCDTGEPAQYCTNTLGMAADTCTSAEMTVFDAFVWICGNSTREGVVNALPEGSATVVCTDIDDTDADACTAGSTLAITVSWQEVSDDKDDDTPVTKSIVLNTVP